MRVDRSSDRSCSSLSMSDNDDFMHEDHSDHEDDGDQEQQQYVIDTGDGEEIELDASTMFQLLRRFLMRRDAQLAGGNEDDSDDDDENDDNNGEFVEPPSQEQMSDALKVSGSSNRSAFFFSRRRCTTSRISLVKTLLHDVIYNRITIIEYQMQLIYSL
jgi:hypothetical protein